MSCLQLSSCIVDEITEYKYEAVALDGKRVEILKQTYNKVYIDIPHVVGDTVMFHEDTGHIYESQYCRKAVITKFIEKTKR
ncbi:MAG TPA: hypothetical protein VNR38_00890 [Ureibacillus sp.]|nr:hypothetical protein [Ureibacillus sp.]